MHHVSRMGTSAPRPSQGPLYWSKAEGFQGTICHHHKGQMDATFLHTTSAANRVRYQQVHITKGSGDVRDQVLFLNLPTFSSEIWGELTQDLALITISRCAWKYLKHSWSLATTHKLGPAPQLQLCLW